MNQPQPSRHDLSLEPNCSLPRPSEASLGIEQPLTSTGPLFGDGRRSFEPPPTSRWSDTAQRVWDRTRHQAEDLATTVSHKAEDVMCQVTRWIRQNPGTSLLCGFSIGFLLADTIIYLRSGRRQ